MNAFRWRSVVAAALGTLLLGGCPLDFSVDFGDGLTRLVEAVDEFQREDPRDAELPDVLIEQGDTIIIADEVNIIADPEDELDEDELPDQTLLGFENLTGFDVYLRYTADGIVQGVLIFDGETLLLEYPCLDDVELLSEDDIDPRDGFLVDSFDLTGNVFLRGFDFECGDALLLTIEPDAITFDADVIEF